MQITKVTAEQNPLFLSEKMPVNNDQLQREFDYYRAEKLMIQMLEKSIISKSEFNKIMLLNRESFSPRLAQIMPDIS